MHVISQSVPLERSFPGLWSFEGTVIPRRQATGRYAEVVAQDYLLVDPGRPPWAQLLPPAAGRNCGSGCDPDLALTAKLPDEFEIIHDGKLGKAAHFIQGRCGAPVT